MSSPEQYAFEEADTTLGQQPNNLLPSEFQWQPINGTGNGGTAVDQTGTVVDQSGGTVVDQTGGQYTTVPYTEGTGQYTTVPYTEGTGQYTTVPYTDTSGMGTSGTGYYTDANGQPIGGTDTSGQPIGGTGQYTDTTGQYTTDTSGGIVPNNSGIVDGSGQYVPGAGTETLPQQPSYSDGVVVPPQTGQMTPTEGSYQIDPNTGQVVLVDSAGNVYQVDQNTGQPIVTDQSGGQTGGYQIDPTTGQPIVPSGQGVPTDQGQIAPQTPVDGTQSSGDLTGGKDNGLDAAWWLERGGTLAGSGLGMAKFAPNLAAFMPEGARIPTLNSMKAIPKEEWGNAIKSPLGKAIGGAFIADTLLDGTILKDRETSWLTLGVDIATPFLLNRFAPGLGVGKTIGLSVGAHALEKMIFEDKKE